MDIRILRTKNKLINTLDEMLKTKNIKDITVFDLCHQANVNRTTFYKYYDDIDDLVLKIEEELMIELKTYIEDIKRNYLLTYSSKIIEKIANEKTIFNSLIGPNGDHTFLRRILYNVYNESIEEWQKLLKKANSNDLKNIFNFIIDGSIGIINNWINTKCKEDPQNISIFINKICMSGLSSFI